MTAAYDRLARLFRRISDRTGWTDVRPTRADLLRVLVALVASLACALIAVDWTGAPAVDLTAGGVAPRTVKAPITYRFPDEITYADARAAARASVEPVWAHDLAVGEAVSARVAQAFAAGRAAATAGGGLPEIGLVFRTELGANVPDETIAVLDAAGFPASTKDAAVTLLQHAMAALIVEDRAALPKDRRPIRVVDVDGGADVGERVVTEYAEFLTASEARQQITLGAAELLGSPFRGDDSPDPTAAPRDGALRDAASTVARAAVQSNTGFDAAATDARRTAVESAVQMPVATIPRGAILFRQGDVLTPADVQAFHALRTQQGTQDPRLELAAIAAFVLLLLVSLYQFGASWLTGFSTRVRDVVAAGALLVATAAFARFVVAAADGVSSLVGYEADPTSVWYAVPVAASAMLVRLLLGVPWTMVFGIGAAAVCGLVMDLQALPMVFFVVSALAGASAVEHTRERLTVLRAGVTVGVVDAACVLLIHFVQLFVVEGQISVGATLRPVWSMGFAFFGGIASAFLVLGTLPLFEWFGFVTDYRMMELANPNHPLLRQLMLRAPGSYHHSVVVGSLAEAGCEAIGANALQAKVCAYFHDIGKSLKPLYFVENQRDNLNRHESLDPWSSAQILISHVTDGARMARDHHLPQPIIDNIYMHHGTGLLQYFFLQAQARSPDPSRVDEKDFRYPGPKPNTREAGVVMLADKVEAATRTIRHPDEHNIRVMIARIVSSVMADGQFSECPLTFEEIHRIADAFVHVLLGIHHQRLEYAATADVSRRPPSQAANVPREALITLELPASDLTAARREPVVERPEPVPTPQLQRVDDVPTLPPASVRPGWNAAEPALAELPELGRVDDPSDVVDYESLEHLPKGQ